MRSTDIVVDHVRLETQEYRYRTPIKFGGVALDRVTLLNAEVTVQGRNGRLAQGWGSMPLGNVWAFPSAQLSYDQTLLAMKRVAERVAQIHNDAKLWGHPIEISWQLEDEFLKSAADIARELSLDQAIPPLATLVSASPIDAAVHDAYGRLHGLNCYSTYRPPFIEGELEPFLGAEFRGVSFDQAITKEPAAQLPLYHLVGALDPIDADEVAVPVGDGLPECLSEWIEFNGLTHLKIKLNGDDLEWDVDRVARVESTTAATQAKRGVTTWKYSLDFNERCRDVDYLLAFIDDLRLRSPSAFSRVAYIEQPTARDLRAHRNNVVHAASRQIPVVIDESLVDLESLLLAREMGYTGAALKSCKGQSPSIVLAAAARHLGMFLCVQDLTCPGASLIQSAALAAHVKGVTAIEANARQYCPIANRGWEDRFPGIFRIRDGRMHTDEITGIGLGAFPEKRTAFGTS